MSIHEEEDTSVLNNRSSSQKEAATTAATSSNNIANDNISKNDTTLNEDNIINSSSFASTSNSNIRKRENPAACIFVASLNKNVQDDELHASVFDHFKQWGTLIGVKVLKDWLKRPYAFVQYESVVDSRLALEEAPGTIINGRSIRCEPARVNRSICLISFNQPFNKQFLQSKLSAFGEIEDITILQPYGKFHFVFIKYQYRDDAIKAYLALKGADNNNNRNNWFVEWASNLDVNTMYGSGVNGASFTSRCLDKFSIFVGNLHESTTEADLKDEFGVFGTILNIHVIRKPYHHRHKRVFAFIKYQNEGEAANAIDQENGKLWNEKVIRVCYREYYHNRNIYPSPTVSPTSCYYYYNNNKQTPAPYFMMMEQQQQQQQKAKSPSQQQQQIMTAALPVTDEPLLYTPYNKVPVTPPLANTNTAGAAMFDPYYTYANTTTAPKASSATNSGSTTTTTVMPQQVVSPELFNNNNNKMKSQGIFAAGTYYPINVEDNGLYNNTPPYYIADPYSTTATVPATPMVYYPYPVQPYYYNTGNNYSTSSKKSFSSSKRYTSNKNQ